MIGDIIRLCNERYQTKDAFGSCHDCTYGRYCPNDCEECLELIHFPKHAPDGAPPRKYDCPNMADYYVCKYTCKYASEMVHALKNLTDLKLKNRINVLSFGCGPCTDLMAFDFLRQKNRYCYDEMDFRGIDYSEQVWSRIHNDIQQLDIPGLDVNIYYSDACDIISSIKRWNWTPDIVTFQYFFSDMHKNCSAENIIEFIREFSKYFNEKISPSSYIVLNDINLANSYGGGRDYFEMLYSCLIDCKVKRGRFYNNNPSRGTYPYGSEEFRSNGLFFNTKGLSRYSPYESCSSAQMIIKKDIPL